MSLLLAPTFQPKLVFLRWGRNYHFFLFLLVLSLTTQPLFAWRHRLRSRLRAYGELEARKGACSFNNNTLVEDSTAR
eukprot:104532-Prorocentrum_minimum.AAC.5